MKVALFAVLTLALSLFNTPPRASEVPTGLLFPLPVAKQLLTDLTFCQDTRTRLSVCDQTTATLQEESRQLTLHLAGLAQDKQLLTDASASLATVLTQTQAALEQAERSRPSRRAWFTSGVVVTVVAALLAGFALR